VCLVDGGRMVGSVDGGGVLGSFVTITAVFEGDIVGVSVEITPTT